MGTTAKRRPRRTGRKTSASTAERAAKVQALRDRLGEWEGDADEGMIAAALAQHDGYSPRNAMLIAMQMPEATDVDGFRKWLDRGRHVKPGEHGVQILAPCQGKRDEQGSDQGDEAKGEVVAEWSAPGADPDAPGLELTSKQPRMRFRLVTVFDVSQTESEDEYQARLAAKRAEREAAEAVPSLRWNAHRRDDGEPCEWSGHVAVPAGGTTTADDYPCPLLCQASHVVDEGGDLDDVA